ncbi:hypothetical protein GDO78_019293, partial [Eleutherodactylus coqui]
VSLITPLSTRWSTASGRMRRSSEAPQVRTWVHRARTCSRQPTAPLTRASEASQRSTSSCSGRRTVRSLRTAVTALTSVLNNGAAAGKGLQYCWKPALHSYNVD